MESPTFEIPSLDTATAANTARDPENPRERQAQALQEETG